MNIKDRLVSAIRDVPDFPKPGILFRDITPALADAELLRSVVGQFAEVSRPHSVSKVVGIDARGFLFGAAVACELGVGFIPVRKSGKLPAETVSQSYALEYGEATVEMHKDAVVPGEKVVVIDDLLATGGTAEAACKLVEQLGGQVCLTAFLIELSALGGRDRLAPRLVTAQLVY